MQDMMVYKIKNYYSVCSNIAKGVGTRDGAGGFSRLSFPSPPRFWYLVVMEYVDKNGV